jgi:hypothetical protein
MAYSKGQRINEDMVPISTDTIFIRGFPSSLNAELILGFFTKKCGSCIIVWQKEVGEKLFIALK